MKSRDDDIAMPYATAVTDVLPGGQRLTAIVLRYEKEIDAASVSPEKFTLSSGRVTAAYPSQNGEPGNTAASGCHIVLELDADDPGLLVFRIENFGKEQKVVRKLPELEIRQEGDLRTEDGETIPGTASVIPLSAERNLRVEDFTEEEFTDPETGVCLRYSLFIPADYNRSGKYPLVCFIHDRGVCSPGIRTGLVQGQGGVIWASPEEQALRECLVLVPHYDETIVNDDFEAAPALDATVRLISSLQNSYCIDPDRIYGTGQSMGCMAMMEIGIRHPGLFGGLLLTAGQWDPDRIAAVSAVSIWILVAEGDTRAYDGMNACIESLEAAGARVKRSVWDGRIRGPEAERLAEEMIDPSKNIFYTVFNGNSVVPAGSFENEDLPVMLQNHMSTWRHIYQIKKLREWLFMQTRKNK